RALAGTAAGTVAAGIALAVALLVGVALPLPLGPFAAPALALAVAPGLAALVALRIVPLAALVTLAVAGAGAALVAVLFWVVGRLALALAGAVAVGRVARRVALRRPGPARQMDERVLRAGPRQQRPDHEQRSEHDAAHGQPHPRHRGRHLQAALPQVAAQ